MIIVASLEAAAIIVIAWLLLRHMAAAERAWTVERRELLERIQRPERIPVQAAAEFHFEEAEPDELELIGTIAEPPEEG